MSEENIKPIEVVKAEEHVISTTISAHSNSMERTLSQVINLNNDNEMHEPTCLICSSPLRKEAEEIWEKNRKDSEVQELFTKRSGSKVSKEVVQNHMRNHFNQGVRELQKVEYINRLQRLKNQNSTTLSKIDMAETIIIERITGINSIPPGTGDMSHAEVEKLKSTETTKLVGQLEHLIKLRASVLGEMKSSGDMISMPTQAFVDIFREELRLAKNDREKELINSILNRLRKLCA